MAFIKSRKHAPLSMTQHVGTALAAMLLPVAAHAADTPAAPAAPAAQSGQTMQEVKVLGAKENDFKADKANSPKYTEALVNTPQTITVIKRELIEQQGAVTLTEALRNTPGVGTFFLGENGSTNTGDAVYMRGFDTSGSIYVDGVRDVGAISRDVFNIEQIDVLKGPAGTDSGRSSPTGSINLTSKQATLENAFGSIVTVGSAKQKRVAVDWNHVINAETGTAVRLNVLDQDSDNPARREVKNKRWAIAPTVAFGLNGKTRVYLDFLHVKQDNVPDGGVPTVGLPGYTSPDASRPYIGSAPKVDPQNFYGSRGDFDKVKADMVTLRLEHDFSPTLKLQNTTRYGKTQQNYLLTGFMGSSDNLWTQPRVDPKTQVVTDVGAVAGNPNTWKLARTVRTVRDRDNTILTNQTNVTAEFDTGAFKHTLVGGLELTSEKQTSYGYGGTGTFKDPTPLYAPDAGVPLEGLNLVRNGTYIEATVNTQSAYLFDTVKIGDKWMINGGLRLDRFDIGYSDTVLSTLANQPKLPVNTLVPTRLNAADTLVNGKIAALYKPTPDSSVYAMYATSKAPPGGNTFSLSASANSASNATYDSQVTTTKEIGTKWDFLKQKLALTAALYQTVVKNEVEQDPLDQKYYQTGKKRVQGIEIGVTGELMRNWLVSAGYTRMNTSVESGKIVTANNTNSLVYTPKQAFTAWTAYTLPMGLKVGGGARFVDQLLRGTDGAVGTPASTDAYWVYDAMATYPVNKNVDLQLNVYNLADKQYVASINKSGYRYTPGAPRSVSVSANFHF
ncbi:catecholate siderophore receptor Fiu [Rugamonas sp. CCM 8940]|uniref:catecholate siderophore receptor Fiu n=1 Tax=Rugamonas sp. CCM 8940 TaxID=2765359 RepID=UPI0018F71289|nr:catecholate siderophore receptor Fiu [Rugamonas sp. CCM 8940]MBJ7311595.1 catecholate siderophore receptor Fiu [Rugamonas sp. CCM 8940]